jgi:hypothetical protein
MLHRDGCPLARQHRRSHQRRFQWAGPAAASRGEKFQLVGTTIW